MTIEHNAHKGFRFKGDETEVAKETVIAIFRENMDNNLSNRVKELEKIGLITVWRNSTNEKSLALLLLRRRFPSFVNLSICTYTSKQIT